MIMIKLLISKSAVLTSWQCCNCVKIELNIRRCRCNMTHKKWCNFKRFFKILMVILFWMMLCSFQTVPSHVIAQRYASRRNHYCEFSCLCCTRPNQETRIAGSYSTWKYETANDATEDLSTIECVVKQKLSLESCKKLYCSIFLIW